MMTMKNSILSAVALAAALAFAGAAAAQPLSPPASVQAQTETAVIRVNGLVCDFCVQTVKRMAGQRPEIARADVDLDQGRVTITFKLGQTLSDAALRTLITNAGYAVVGITRRRV
jgi:copper chaperone CopZ